jgi:hypothetical protein
MLIRRLAPLSLLLLAPSLAWAAPADSPPVQRPSKPVSEGTESAVEIEAPEDATTEIEPPPATGEEPLESPPSEPAEQPEQTQDLSNLLVSDAEEAAPPAPRVRASNDGTRVDRNERLRNYYARIYRPAHNPSRIYFGARAAFALAGTNEGGGGRMGFVNAELGQTWNRVGYGLGVTALAGGLTYGDAGVAKFAPALVGGGPSLGLGRLGLFGRGYLDLRVGYNFFYAPVASTRPELSDPPDAAPHGPKVHVDVGLLLHDSESRRFRHGLGASIGWQLLVHSFAGDYPRVNSFMFGAGYFFG